MKTIFLSILFTIAFIGCGDNVSPEQELDAKLQGKWRLVWLNNGGRSKYLPDSTNFIISFEKGILTQDDSIYNFSQPYYITTKNGQEICNVRTEYESIVTDSEGNSSVIIKVAIYDIFLTKNDTLNYNLSEPILYGEVESKYIRVK